MRRSPNSNPKPGRPRVHKQGGRLGRWDYVIALAGNPNVGKSTIFNALTGLHQHTGNWPGKTMTRAEGAFVRNQQRYKVVDLPGTYSLWSASRDEDVARDVLLFGRPDVTVVVADATRLERNLNLVLQVLQITERAVLALNLMDEARAFGWSIDAAGLATDLGIPVVPTAARSGQGIPDLLQAIEDVATGRTVCRPHRPAPRIRGLQPALARLAAAVSEAYPTLAQPEWLALRLLEGDPALRQAVESGAVEALAADGATWFGPDRGSES